MFKKVVGVKYCGGCNSVIDRVGLVEEIQKALPAGYAITTEPSRAPWDVGVIICGCAAACADRTQTQLLAKRWIVVAGTAVDLNKVPEEKIAEIVVDKIIQPSDGRLATGGLSSDARETHEDYLAGLKRQKPSA